MEDDEDKCPICRTTLPKSSNAINTASESHIDTCIRAQIASQEHIEEVDAPAERKQRPESVDKDEDECPICYTSLMTRAFNQDPSLREAHVNACLDGENGKSAPKTDRDPASVYSDNNDTSSRNLVKRASTFGSGNVGSSNSKASKSLQRSSTMQTQEHREVGALRSWFSNLGGEPRSKDQKIQDRKAKADTLMWQRWDHPQSPTYEMVMRYWTSTRMQQHWEYLQAQHPRQFKRSLEKGYMEPIPTSWVRDRRLAYLYPEGSYYETPAEKRLYYLLNNGVMPDGSRHAPMRPLNIVRDRYTIIARGNERNARQVHLDAQKLAAYRSPGDVFQSDKQIKSHNYSDQVPNVVYEARTRALHELADGILHGTDHLETMLLIDVSGSMTWNPHRGILGPDGVYRYHDQPSNIRLVEHLVHRALHLMIPRAQKEHPNQTGIDAVTFSTFGSYIGQLSASRFRSDWASRVRLGGGTQVMQGWQVVKNTYFQHQHANYGHGRWDPVFGWQPTPGMPKLSLLVFLDGEANDMDEFELELLGETWAYVTIALVGMENCPHHHSHAIELERVARFNPHVGFFDVHGRVCERMVVEDLLSSVYPVDPPQYSEVLKPAYDLPPEELPAYSEY